MRRRIAVAGLVVAGLLVCAPRAVQAQDSLFGFHIGGFIPRGFDGRDINDDVLRANTEFLDYFTCDNSDPIRCFNGFTFSGEYLLGLGDYLEAGVSVGYYKQKEAARYIDFTDVDNTEIINDTTFENIPVAVTLRAFPIGRTTPVQPYVGGGVVFHRWGYKEEGEFIDFTPGAGRPIFVGEFEDDGTAVGATVLGGVRAPIGPNFFVGGEVRWQSGTGDLDPDLTFAANELDLGGVTVMAGVHFKF
jgi:opacity protein-like surface antigen